MFGNVLLFPTLHPLLLCSPFCQCPLIELTRVNIETCAQSEFHEARANFISVSVYQHGDTRKDEVGPKEARQNHLHWGFLYCKITTFGSRQCGGGGRWPLNAGLMFLNHGRPFIQSPHCYVLHFLSSGPQSDYWSCSVYGRNASSPFSHC